MELFRSALSESRLCQPRSTADVDELAALYDNELTRMLDQTLPARHYMCRQRLSDPYLDRECRDAKRSSRRLQRAYAAANHRAVAAAAASSAAVSDEAAKAADAMSAWYSQRRLYRKRKCSEFYRDKFEASTSNPRRLWNTVDELLGRGRVPASSTIGVEAFQQFFVDAK